MKNFIITALLLFFAGALKAQTAYDRKQDYRISALESKVIATNTIVAAQKLTIDSLNIRIIKLEMVQFYRPIVFLKGLEFINDTLRLKQ